MGIVNAILSKVLKRLFRQTRPISGLHISTYGMPSSHSMTLWYFFVTIVTAAYRYGSAYGPHIPSLLSAIVGIYTLLASTWRMHTGLHTPSQTAVGAAIGSAVGYITAKMESNWASKSFIEGIVTRGYEMLSIFINNILSSQSIMTFTLPSVSSMIVFTWIPNNITKNVRLMIICGGGVILYGRNLRNLFRVVKLRLCRTSTWSPHSMIKSQI
jgi:hypothetical protein